MDSDGLTNVKCLSMPKEIPEYRRQRSHLDFVSNIPISATQFKRDLANLFPAATWQNKLTPSEMLLLDDLKAKFPFQVDIHPQ